MRIPDADYGVEVSEYDGGYDGNLSLDAAGRAGLASSLTVAAIALLVMFAAKVAVCLAIGADDVHVIVPGRLMIVHAENAGFAGGALWGSAAVRVFSAIGVGLALPIVRVAHSRLIRHVAGVGKSYDILIGLAIAGLLSNGIERLIAGSVTDYMYIVVDGATMSGPVANLADLALFVGGNGAILSLLIGLASFVVHRYVRHDVAPDDCPCCAAPVRDGASFCYRCGAGLVRGAHRAG